MIKEVAFVASFYHAVKYWQGADSIKILEYSDRKKRHLAQKGYVSMRLKNVCKVLSSAMNNINKASDETVISDIAMSNALLDEILNNLTYEE